MMERSLIYYFFNCSDESLYRMFAIRSHCLHLSLTNPIRNLIDINETNNVYMKLLTEKKISPTIVIPKSLKKNFKLAHITL